jgi:hypothetical protein
MDARERVMDLEVEARAVVGPDRPRRVEAERLAGKVASAVPAQFARTTSLPSP